MARNDDRRTPPIFVEAAPVLGGAPAPHGPHVAERFKKLLAEGQVRIFAGKAKASCASENGVTVTVRDRRTGRDIELAAGWVINCTGPSPSNRPASNPAIASLLVRGEIRLDELALGLETAANGAAIRASGVPAPNLFVVGTLRKPAFWESTAVPELREQPAEVAGEALRQVQGRARARLEAREPTHSVR